MVKAQVLLWPPLSTGRLLGNCQACTWTLGKQQFCLAQELSELMTVTAEFAGTFQLLSTAPRL